MRLENDLGYLGIKKMEEEIVINYYERIGKRRPNMRLENDTHLRHLDIK